MIGIGSDHLTYRAVRQDTGRGLALKEFKPAGRMVRAADRQTLRTRDTEDQASFDALVAEVAAQSEGRERFRHPNVVAVFDSVVQNGTAYLATDRYRGRPLSELLGEGEVLDRNEIDEILPPLLDGLEALHADGLLQLDIGPASLFIRQDGRPMLGRGTLFPPARLTEGGTFVLGEEDAYLSEEHLFAELRLGPWSDIYGLAATFFRLACGHPPANVVKRIKETARKRPDPVADAIVAMRASWHDEFLAAIEGGLAIAAEDRIASVAAFREVLTHGMPAEARRRAANDRPGDHPREVGADPLAEEGPPTVRVIRGGRASETAPPPRPSSLLLRPSGRAAAPALPSRPMLRLYRGGKEVVEPAPAPEPASAPGYPEPAPASPARGSPAPVSAAPARPPVSAASLSGEDLLSARFTLFAPAPGAAAWSDTRWTEACLYLHEPGLETTVKRHAEARAQGRTGEPPRPRDAAQLALIPGAPVAIVPETETVAVNPGHATLAWHETFHRFDFRLRAAEAGAPAVELVDRLLFFVGPVLVGEAPLTRDTGAPFEPGAAITTPGYTRIYACHAAEDRFVGAAVDGAVRHLRMPFLGESAALRAKREWDREIFRRIERAQIFLLFWSAAAAGSARLRKEWEFALDLDRDRFVRVVRHRDDDTPLPADLARLPRHRLWV